MARGPACSLGQFLIGPHEAQLDFSVPLGFNTKCSYHHVQGSLSTKQNILLNKQWKDVLQASNIIFPHLVELANSNTQEVRLRSSYFLPYVALVAKSSDTPALSGGKQKMADLANNSSLNQTF